jgi:hypothetical protein
MYLRPRLFVSGSDEPAVGLTVAEAVVCALPVIPDFGQAGLLPGMLGPVV